MEQIPEEYRDEVKAVLDGVKFADYTAPQIALAAILVERKRCAEVARKEGEGYRDHNLPQAAMGAFQAAKAIEAGQ